MTGPDETPTMGGEALAADTAEVARSRWRESGLADVPRTNSHPPRSRAGAIPPPVEDPPDVRFVHLQAAVETNAARMADLDNRVARLERSMGKGDSPAVIAQNLATLRSEFNAFLEGYKADEEAKANPEARPQGIRTVTVQSVTPLVYALVAGIIYGLIGAAGGAASAMTAIQQTGGDITLGPVLAVALIAGLTAFVTRTMEGVRDQQRSADVPLSAPVAAAEKA